MLAEGLQKCLDNLSDYCEKWGLLVIESKTKTMIFTKSKWTPEKFHYGNSEIACVKSVQYLGFNISYNFNIKVTIQYRQCKASKMSYLFLRALRTSNNVSAKLTMNLFDKSISPIPLYGCAVWWTPKSYNLIYLVDQPECLGSRHTVTNALHAVCGYPVEFSSARRVGKKNTTISRPILINSKHFQDVEIIHCYKGPYKFQAYEDKSRSEIDGFHLKFCKTSLNISNYASNLAVLGELGRYPLTFTCLIQQTFKWNQKWSIEFCIQNDYHWKQFMDPSHILYAK